MEPGKVQNALLRHQVEPAVIECALERVRNEVGDQSMISGIYSKAFRAKGIAIGSKRYSEAYRAFASTWLR